METEGDIQGHKRENKWRKKSPQLSRGEAAEKEQQALAGGVKYSRQILLWLVLFRCQYYYDFCPLLGVETQHKMFNTKETAFLFLPNATKLKILAAQYQR